MIYDKLLRRLVESVKRLTSGVQGQIGAYEICTRARVARLAECCLKQKMGYGRDTNPIQLNIVFFCRIRFIEISDFYENTHYCGEMVYFN